MECRHDPHARIGLHCLHRLRPQLEPAVSKDEREVLLRHRESEKHRLRLSLRHHGGSRIQPAVVDVFSEFPRLLGHIYYRFSVLILMTDRQM